MLSTWFHFIEVDILTTLTPCRGFSLRVLRDKGAIGKIFPLRRQFALLILLCIHEAFQFLRPWTTPRVDRAALVFTMIVMWYVAGGRWWRVFVWVLEVFLDNCVVPAGIVACPGLSWKCWAYVPSRKYLGVWFIYGVCLFSLSGFASEDDEW